MHGHDRPVAARTYEAVITGVDENTVNPQLVEGEYLFAIEPRAISNTYGRSAATMRRMTSASPLPHGSRRSIVVSTRRSFVPPFARRSLSRVRSSPAR